VITDLPEAKTKEECLTLIKRREVLLSVIADSYRRMATNSSLLYRQQQLDRCGEYLRELTEINAADPLLFNLSAEHLFR
jgi:hypothetical protein